MERVRLANGNLFNQSEKIFMKALLTISAILMILISIVAIPVITIVHFLKIRIWIVFLLLLFIGCEKAPVTDVKCYDCLIKQDNGIEYSAVFCVNPEQYQQLMDNENYIITCKEK